MIKTITFVFNYAYIKDLNRLMIDIEIMQDASEIIHYDSPDTPYAIQARLLSQYTDMKALCHWHPDMECIHVFEGEMFYDVNGEKILLTAGDSIIVNSQQLHFGYSNQNRECRFAVILFHPGLFQSNVHNYQKNVYPVIHSSGITHWFFPKDHPAAGEITKVLLEIFAQHKKRPEDVDCLLIGLFHCLWHTIYQHSNQSLHDDNIQESPDVKLQKQMVSYVYDHYSENVGLEDIAAAANISRSKCCKIFQQYLQQSPVAFLNAYRMEISCNLLRNTSYSITEIALSCGYNHLSYFSKIFLQKFGCTPNQYRKKPLV